MMTVNFMPMEVTTYLHCRRGRSVFRKVRIDIGIKEAIYNALPQATLEVVDATGHIWSRGDIKENRGRIILDYKGPPKVAFDPQAYAKQQKAEAEAKAKKESFNTRLAALEKKQEKEYSKNQEAALDDDRVNLNSDVGASLMGITTDDERTTTSESDQRPKEKDDDDLQQVGEERDHNGETLRRAVHLQVPLVGRVDAQLVRKEERGAEGGSNGLHSSNDEPHVLDNRYAPRVRLISPTDEDAGRD